MKKILLATLLLILLLFLIGCQTNKFKDLKIIDKKEIPNEEKIQICNVPISNALIYAVSLNPNGICMGGELGELIVPPVFVDDMNKPIPNLQPKGYLDQNSQILRCSISCNIPVKITCLKDFGITTQGANYEENLVDRLGC